MKINEVLVTEGIGDYIPGTTGNKMRKAASAEQKRLDQIVELSLTKWAKVSQQIAASGQPADVNDVAAWASKYIGRNVSSSPANMNTRSLKQWLTKEIGSYLRQKAGAPQHAPTQQPAPASRQAPTQQPAPATLWQPNQNGTQPAPSSLGITLVPNPSGAVDPVVMQYKGKNFMLNNRGQWALDGSDRAGAEAAGQIQAEMDRVAQI